MERQLASIQRIEKLEPIEGADAIERATILGWQCVVKKGDFEAGNFCVYCEIDSVLPERPEFEFLRQRKFRVKTIKLRGQISQGIAFPLTILPPMIVDRSPGLGDDVTEMLGVVKWEPAIAAHLAGLVKGNFPSFIPRTDEPRIQAFPWILECFADVDFVATEKLDGTSFTAYVKDGNFGVCSRRLELKEQEGNAYWNAAKSLNLSERLASLGKNIAVQGELIGPGIQQNKYKLKAPRLYVFNVFEIDSCRFCGYLEIQDYMQSIGVEIVPQVSIGRLPKTVPELVELAQGKSRVDVLNQNQMREGLVFRPLQEMQVERMGRLSFKVVNPDFLLKYDE